jgi:hypothetical protein
MNNQSTMAPPGPSLSPSPYAEPFMIRTISKAKRRATDPKPCEPIALLDDQEAQHVRLHVLFDEATGGDSPELSELEAELARDLAPDQPMRSLKWNLAY